MPLDPVDNALVQTCNSADKVQAECWLDADFKSKQSCKRQEGAGRAEGAQLQC